MFKIKFKSKYTNIIGNVYIIGGAGAYEVTKIGTIEDQPCAYGISINGGFEQPIFLLKVLDNPKYSDRIKLVQYGQV